MTVNAIVTDIEGTTSSIAFVHDVLFPYAARELEGFLRQHGSQSEIAAILEEVKREADQPDADLDTVIQILLDWIAADRKVTALKTLQGMIWERGYENADFTGHIYDDAAECLKRWVDQGIRLYIYSSGSEAAQKLLFGHSDAGDLRELFSGYFDTRVGHKRETAAYQKIADQIGLPADEILFLSDVLEELDAAAGAGMQTTQLVRSDELSTGVHPVAGNFFDVVLD